MLKKNTEKVIQPLLRENGCGDLKINTTSWPFIIAKSKPEKEEWNRLIGWTDELQGSQQRQTIPVNGKLKLQDNTIYLQLYMKYLKLKEITAAGIKNARDMNNTYKDHDQLLLAATEEKPEEQYYSCTLPIGSCSRNNLTNRSQKAILDFGINMQDLKFEMGNKHFKLYKNVRG